MITIESGENKIRQCYASPLFELHNNRVRCVISYITSYKNNNGEWETIQEPETKVRVINNDYYMNAVTKEIKREEEIGFFPAYDTILSSKVMDIIPDHESLTKEEILATPLYQRIASYVESIIEANNWQS